MNKLILRLKKHYLPFIFTVLIVGLIFYLKKPYRDFITYITDTTGYVSIIGIAILLIIGTVNLLLKHKNPISTYFRRDLGITAGILAIIHSITGLFVHLRGKNWQYFFIKVEHGYSIRLDNFGLANYTGLISSFIIILLLITSNDYLLRKLNSTNWKIIQRFTYLMYVLAIIHCVYYRIVLNKINLIYYLYLPLFIIVLLFQLIGIRLKLIRQRKQQL